MIAAAEIGLGIVGYMLVGVLVAAGAHAYDRRRGYLTDDVAWDGLIAISWPIVVMMAAGTLALVTLGKLSRWQR